MERVKSYVCGEWVRGSEAAEPLRNPTTEEVIGECAAEGIDYAACLEYARRKGGPVLRGMSFAARGRILERMSKITHELRDELIELAVRNGGNTRADAKFDIDGASHTLATYARIGEGLGDRTFVVDGEIEQLGRSPRFVGGHIAVPLTGAAVHINAFNFPAWGVAEKAAVALLAGMPVVTRPATSTALVAARLVEALVSVEALPAGALSFIAGGRAASLLDPLSSQDVVAFTGSRTTGEAVRGRTNVLRESVRINVEADSLNAAVLGPDAGAAGATYDLFVRDTVHEMTQKAGQKCTATRRIFVPAALLERAQEDLAAGLRAVTVGDPARRDVSMGPLVSAEQLASVREGIELLQRTCATVHDGSEHGELLGVEAGKGYFIAPVLLIAAAAREANIVHEHEVFGPVATLMPYNGDPAEAACYVRLGNGGLVSSVYTDDREFARAMVFALAPHHGRVYLGSARVAEQAPGPGTVLPLLVHGGPGHAGGGEELGGPRGLAFYLQRVAIEGDRPMVEKILGVS
ncbi:MAG: 3,4-dehydroadipyl-CoA semialdehyde dehydrogenase [Candidatus Schekmanbacteria bacterium]|nr:3,4-dehydroadipyl-CoA semialdehyde dehydrogenase [Candidatus Schekmanbacteria bacterium]